MPVATRWSSSHARWRTLPLGPPDRVPQPPAGNRVLGLWREHLLCLGITVPRALPRCQGMDSVMSAATTIRNPSIHSVAEGDQAAIISSEQSCAVAARSCPHCSVAECQA